MYIALNNSSIQDELLDLHGIIQLKKNVVLYT